MVLDFNAWWLPALTALLGLVGVAMVWVACWARGWPSVTGTIDISIYDRVGADSVDSAMKLYLSYSYAVGRRDYAGQNVSPPLVVGTNSDQKSARLFRERTRVKVYYCPWRPGISCLERGSVLKSFMLAALIIGVAGSIWVAAR